MEKYFINSLLEILQKTIRFALWNTPLEIRKLIWKIVPYIRKIFRTDRNITTTYYQNISITCNLKYHLDSQIFWQEMQEGDLAVHFYLEQNLGRNHIFIDIGAGIGTFSLIAAKKCKKVIAFEPCPLHYTKLKQNVSLNNFNNINLFNIALSSTSGTGKLYIPSHSNLGMSSLVKKTNCEQSVIVKMETLDNFFTHHPIKKDMKILIKIDVEGHELNVLKGGTSFILKYQPQIILEVNPQHLSQHNSSIKELLSYLDSINYSSFLLKHNYKTFKLEKIYSVEQVKQHQNILAKPAKKSRTYF